MLDKKNILVELKNYHLIIFILQTPYLLNNAIIPNCFISYNCFDTILRQVVNIIKQKYCYTLNTLRSKTFYNKSVQCEYIFYLSSQTETSKLKLALSHLREDHFNTHTYITIIQYKVFWEEKKYLKSVYYKNIKYPNLRLIIYYDW